MECWEDSKRFLRGYGLAFSVLTRKDILESTEFLRPYLNGKTRRKVKSGSALGKIKMFLILSSADVGAGIGRISKLLLSRFFDHVDLLEVTQKFLEVAKKDLANIEQVKNFYCSSMQVRPFPYVLPLQRRNSSFLSNTT